jgi:hypothetical protein
VVRRRSVGWDAIGEVNCWIRLSVKRSGDYSWLCRGIEVEDLRRPDLASVEETRFEPE